MSIVRIGAIGVAVGFTAMRLERFNGEAWELFGDVIGAD
jgi:hypothetical protein